MADGVRCVKITSGSVSSWYLVTEIGCDVGGRGWTVLRLGAAEPYHVRIAAPDGDHCDCLEHTSHSRCKHVAVIRGLMSLEDGSCAVTLG
jgi:hypothetical protein